jgi:hypothetical protein
MKQPQTQDKGYLEDQVGKAQRPLPPPLSINEFDARVKHLAVVLEFLPGLYVKAHEEQGWPPGGSGVHVSGGNPSDSTVDAVTGKVQRGRRQDCLTAIEWLEQAMTAAQNVAAVLRGEEVPQPKKVPRYGATVTQGELDQRIRDKRLRESPEHLRRERELRSE